MLYLKGDAFHELRKFSEARDCYTEILKLESSDVAYTNRALALWELGEYSEALKDYLEALKLNPKNAIASRGAGEMCLKLDEPRKAVGYFRKAISLARKYSEAYTGLGISMMNAGRWDLAVAPFFKALKLNPDDDLAKSGIQKIEDNLNEDEAK